jgi:hypothetical protein
MRLRRFPDCDCTCRCRRIGAYEVRPDIPRWSWWRRLTTGYLRACYVCGVYHADRLLSLFNPPAPAPADVIVRDGAWLDELRRHVEHGESD